MSDTVEGQSGTVIEMSTLVPATSGRNEINTSTKEGHSSNTGSSVRSPIPPSFATAPFSRMPDDPSTTVRENASTTSGQSSVAGPLWIPGATPSVELPSTVIDSASDSRDKRASATKGQRSQRRSSIRRGTQPVIGRATIIRREPPTEGVFTTEREYLTMTGEHQPRVPPAGTPYVPSPVERLMAALPERFEQDNEQNNEADDISDADTGRCSNSFWIVIAMSVFFIASGLFLIYYYDYYRFNH